MIKTKNFYDVIKVFRRQLSKSDKQALRVLVHVYNNQTEFEVQSKSTINRNGFGFRQGDAKALSEIAENYLRTGKVSKETMKILHRRMPAYAWQYTRDLKENGTLVKTREGFKFDIH